MAARKRQCVDDTHTRMTRRLDVRISGEAYERLLIHALKANKCPGELVTELIDRNLREWRIHSNLAVRITNEDQADLADDTHNSEKEAA
jgi:hypothetical protein